MSIRVTIEHTIFEGPYLGLTFLPNNENSIVSRHSSKKLAVHIAAYRWL